MAKGVKSKGSIIYKLLIVLLGAALLFTILYPKYIWDQEDKNTKRCQSNMVHILYAELTYLTENNAYNDTLSVVSDFIKSDTTGTRLRSYMTADSALALDIYNYFKLSNDSLASQIIDSLLAYGKKYDLDTTAALVIDSLKTIDQYAEKIDSIALASLDNFYTCPTTGEDYIVEVNNDSAIKVINITCPIDSLDIAEIKNDFKLNVLGGLKLKNHGNIDNGDKSWINR
ncbi:hypothetical protein JXQ31_07865 [candidate division KSB1 bacterium]|nr:hypothetical protein [candidate division KSB1 bacterium]